MKKQEELIFFTKKDEQDVIDILKKGLMTILGDDITDLFHENKYFGFDINIKIKNEWWTIFVLASNDGEHRVTVDRGVYEIIKKLISVSFC